MEKGDLKKLIKYTCIYAILIFIMTFFICKILWGKFIYKHILKAMIIIGFPPVIIVIFVYVVSNFLKKEKNYKGYYREIDDMHPPAMLSFLLDGFVEAKKDILATILNLSIKKFLNIEKDDSKFKVSVNEDIKDSSKLYYHEKYIINTLRKGEKIYFSEFEKWVALDCENNKLVYNKKNVLAQVMKLIAPLSIARGFWCYGVRIF